MFCIDNLLDRIHFRSCRGSVPARIRITRHGEPKPLPLSFSLSLSLARTHSLSLNRSRSLSPSLSLFLPPALSRSSLLLSPSISIFLTLYFSLLLSLALLSRYFSLTRSLAVCLSCSLALSRLLALALSFTLARPATFFADELNGSMAPYTPPSIIPPSSFVLLSSLELSDTKIYAPQIRAFLGNAAHLCQVRDSRS